VYNSKDNKSTQEKASKIETQPSPNEKKNLELPNPDGFIPGTRYAFGYIGNNYITIPYCPKCKVQLELGEVFPFSDVFHSVCGHVVPPITRSDFECMVKSLLPVKVLLEELKAASAE